MTETGPLPELDPDNTFFWTSGADGRLREDLRPIDGPTWRWIYAMGEDGVELTLER